MKVDKVDSWYELKNLLLQINKKWRLTKAKIQSNLMEIKSNVNIIKISKLVDN